MSSTNHAQLLLRRREVAHVLGVSESQVLKYERAGVLRPVRLPGIRAIRYVASEVDALAAAWIGADAPASAPTAAHA